MYGRTGVLPMLERLRARGFTLASLTNGNAEVARIPALDALFEHSVTAEGAGAAKPASPPFLDLLRRCGVTPDQARAVYP